jgi:glyoxylase-like metal-dependent hydrolase (beta-lactamase superfamily II)
MISFDIVQEGLIEITQEEGVVDSRPTCSLLSLNGFKVLIDLEHPKEDGSEFLEALERLGATPDEIQGVIFTHLHPDHMGHKDLFRNSRFMFQSDEKLAFYFKDDSPIRLHGSYLLDLAPELFDKPRPIFSLPDLGLLGNRLLIQALPGHTAGSQVIFASIGGRVHAWAGDIILNRDYYDRWEPPGSSWNPVPIPDQMRFIKDHADIIIPGHGSPFAIGG